jgi:tetraprenyl-beta-curcumene synthase
MDRHHERCHRAAWHFVRAALVYWAIVWPQATREISHLRARAAQIRDSTLRAAALENLAAERGNLEGAAAFAVLAPRRRRRRLVTALVTFQAIYDYVDTLAEQDAARRLHEHDIRHIHGALRDALSPAPQPLVSQFSVGDDCYLIALVDICRAATRGLASNATVLPLALRAVEGMIEYQARNHGPGPEPAARLAEWQHGAPIRDEDYRWWEAAASAASSLVVFALLALAATPHATEEQATAIVQAYVPIGALHVLLDSYADRDADARSGDHSLIAHYGDGQSESERLTALAVDGRARTRSLPQGSTHLLIASAMVSFYLDGGDGGHRSTASVHRALGPFARATTIVLRARRLIA